MFSSFFRNIFSTFLLIFLVVIFISCFFIPFLSNNPSYSFETIVLQKHDNISISNSGFAWPTPGYNNITSSFGYRKSPTGNSGNFHSGLDIGAPTGSNLVAICDGQIVFCGWSGSGGFAITLVSGNLRISYCHTSPNFFVQKNDFVYRGQIIGKVGPKNVYNIPNNPYRDKNGQPTNGDMTGPHLHLTLKKDGKAVDPMSLF